MGLYVEVQCDRQIEGTVIEDVSEKTAVALHREVEASGDDISDSPFCEFLRRNLPAREAVA